MTPAEALQVASARHPFDVISECGRYRYLLAYPTGHDNDRVALGIFANPSTATACVLPDGSWDTDRTATRWLAYAKRWGYGWAMLGNVRAWRETDPDKVPGDPEAIGPENIRYLFECVQRAEVVVCGWGKLGGTLGPGVLRLIRAAGKVPHALKLNQDGSPAHPLYLRADLLPIPF